MAFTAVTSMLAAAVVTAGVGGAAAQGRILTAADATFALREVGVTKTFTAPSAKWGPFILPTGGRTSAQPLIVRVFPNVAVAHSWSKANPPLSAAEVRGIVPGPYKFLPRLFACNVMVASSQLPNLRSAHPSLTQQRSLAKLLTEIRTAQSRVIESLRRRCAS